MSLEQQLQHLQEANTTLSDRLRRSSRFAEAVHLSDNVVRPIPTGSQFERLQAHGLSLPRAQPPAAARMPDILHRTQAPPLNLVFADDRLGWPRSGRAASALPQARPQLAPQTAGFLARLLLVQTDAAGLAAIVAEAWARGKAAPCHEAASLLAGEILAARQRLSPNVLAQRASREKLLTILTGLIEACDAEPGALNQPVVFVAPGSGALRDVPVMMAALLLDAEAYEVLALTQRPQAAWVAHLSALPPLQRDTAQQAKSLAELRPLLLALLTSRRSGSGFAAAADDTVRVLLNDIEREARPQGTAVLRAALKHYALALVLRGHPQWLGWCLQRLIPVDPTKQARNAVLGCAALMGHAALVEVALQMGADASVRQEGIVTQEGDAHIVSKKYASGSLLHQVAARKDGDEGQRIDLCRRLVRGGASLFATATFAQAGPFAAYSFQRTCPVVHALLAGNAKVAAALAGLQRDALPARCQAVHTLLLQTKHCLERASVAAATGDRTGRDAALREAMDSCDCLVFDQGFDALCPEAPALAAAFESLWLHSRPEPPQRVAQDPREGALEQALWSNSATRRNAILRAALQDQVHLPAAELAQDAAHMAEVGSTAGAAAELSAAHVPQEELVLRLLHVAQQMVDEILGLFARDHQLPPHGVGSAEAPTQAGHDPLAAAGVLYQPLEERQLDQALATATELGMVNYLQSFGPLSTLVLRGQPQPLHAYLDLGLPVSIRDLTHAFVYALQPSAAAGAVHEAHLETQIQSQLQRSLLPAIQTSAHAVAVLLFALRLTDPAPAQAALRHLKRQNLQLVLPSSAAAGQLVGLAAAQDTKTLQLLLKLLGPPAQRARWLACTDATGDTALHVAARQAPQALSSLLAALPAPSTAQAATPPVADLRAQVLEQRNLEHATPLLCAICFVQPRSAALLIAALGQRSFAQLEEASLAHLPAAALRQLFDALKAIDSTLFGAWLAQAYQSARGQQEQADGAQPGVEAVWHAFLGTHTRQPKAAAPAEAAAAPAATGPAPSPPLSPANDWRRQIYAARNGTERSAVVDTFLASPKAHDETHAQRALAAWRILEALHVAGRGHELGHHYAAHRPSMPLAALRARCETFGNFGASRFGPEDGECLLRLRQRALAALAAAAPSPLCTYAVNLYDEGLAGEGYTLLSGQSKHQFYGPSPWLRLILRPGSNTQPIRVISMYPIAPTPQLWPLCGRPQAVT